MAQHVKCAALASSGYNVNFGVSSAQYADSYLFFRILFTLFLSLLSFIFNRVTFGEAVLCAGMLSVLYARKQPHPAIPILANINHIAKHHIAVIVIVIVASIIVIITIIASSAS